MAILTNIKLDYSSANSIYYCTQYNLYIIFTFFCFLCGESNINIHGKNFRSLETRRSSLIESLIVVLVEDKRSTFFDSVSSFQDLEPQGLTEGTGRPRLFCEISYHLNKFFLIWIQEIVFFFSCYYLKWSFCIFGTIQPFVSSWDGRDCIITSFAFFFLRNFAQTNLLKKLPLLYFSSKRWLGSA